MRSFFKTKTPSVDNQSMLFPSSKSSSLASSNSSISTLVENVKDKPFKVMFLNLPYEIITEIAMLSGFFSAISLRQTNSFLFEILDDKLAWSRYHKVKKVWNQTENIYDLQSVDETITKISITSHIDSFDHLIFGKWQQEQHKTLAKSTTLFFEHQTFNQKYDHLGGIKFLFKNKTPFPTLTFFDHRESLPCYIEEVRQQTISGLLPPTLQAGFAGFDTGGVRIDHCCTECIGYERREVEKSFMVLEESRRQPLWFMEGFRFKHCLGGGRKVLFEVNGSKDSSSLVVESMPWVMVAVLVDGRFVSVKSELMKVYNKLVCV